MKKNVQRTISGLLATAMALSLTACGSKTEPEPQAAFTPRLDTEAQLELNVAGFMGNFEALDQVINSFNEYYPNITVAYEQNSAYMLPEYIRNNQAIDIFMTNDANIRDASNAEDFAQAYCLDLSQEDIDFSAIDPNMLAACTVDGAVLRVPLMKNPCGIVVNKTLLENEGLSMPTNWDEFVEVLGALKSKGYTPLQGSHKHLYAELMMGMMENTLAEDSALLSSLEAGDEAAVSGVQPVFERLQTIIDSGYTDYAVNSTLGEDNYDSSIMSFLEGDVPFWVCISECFSGVKKRESKSETFSASPFDYAFVYAPTGDNGVYAYTEPWYGFSVYKNSAQKDYAVEFIRFLATEAQLNTMASVKGMPSAAVNPTDERYPAIHDIANLQNSFDNDGTVSGTVRDRFTEVCNDMGAGVYATAEEAAQAFVASFR